MPTNFQVQNLDWSDSLGHAYDALDGGSAFAKTAEPSSDEAEADGFSD